MTLRQLTLFRAVAQHLSFTRAAAELCLTQPAVSIQIKQLENHIGSPLFEQIGKKIFLTDAGSELYDACQDIFTRIERLEMTLNELQGTIKGQLKISVVSNAKYFTPYLLSKFLQYYPEVHVRMSVTNRTAILNRLSNNEDDLVIMGQVPEQLNVIAHQFLENPLVIVAPPEHHLVDKANLVMQDLAEERFLVREVGSGTRLAMERIFAEHDIELPNEMELGNTEAIKNGVIAGLGLSVLPKHALTMELTMDLLKILPVKDFPIKRYWYITHLADKQLSLVARTFVEFLRNEAKQVIQETLAKLTRNKLP